MRYHNITYDDMKNGDGLRVVLWVSGCSHKCRGCHNAVTWDENDGLIFDEKAKSELFERLDKDYISGLTLSGGDPLFEKNRVCIGKLMAEVKKRFPDKTIWLYTGFLWEEIKGLELIKLADVVVDGKFIAELSDNNLMWKGSSNQRVIDVRKSLEENKVVLKYK